MLYVYLASTIKLNVFKYYSFVDFDLYDTKYITIIILFLLYFLRLIIYNLSCICYFYYVGKAYFVKKKKRRIEDIITIYTCISK